MQHLAALRAAPLLQPGGAGFGPAALCLRCSLEDALPRLLPSPQQQQQPSNYEPTILACELAAADAVLSGRFMELACPPLRFCRTQLQVCHGILIPGEACGCSAGKGSVLGLCCAEPSAESPRAQQLRPVLSVIDYMIVMRAGSCRRQGRRHASGGARSAAGRRR